MIFSGARTSLEAMALVGTLGWPRVCFPSSLGGLKLGITLSSRLVGVCCEQEGLGEMHLFLHAMVELEGLVDRWHISW